MIYIFDIDGTLADTSHRMHLIQQQPKDWDAFFLAAGDDKPIQHICDLYEIIGSHSVDINLWFWTGRSEICREETELWIKEHLSFFPDELRMRKQGDFRPDHILKKEWLESLTPAQRTELLVFEDRTRVVEMWREMGVPCLQVASGDF